MEKILNALNSFITADNIALLSVILTALIFIFSRRVEIKNKQRDDKKIEFIKPIFSEISILFKYFITLPFGKIMTKLFPKLVNKIQQQDSSKK